MDNIGFAGAKERSERSSEKLSIFGIMIMLVSAAAFIFYVCVFLFGGKTQGQVVDIIRGHGRHPRREYTVAYTVDGEQCEVTLDYIFTPPGLGSEVRVHYFPPVPGIVFSPVNLFYSLVFLWLGYWFRTKIRFGVHRQKN